MANIWLVSSYKLHYIIGFGLVEMATSTNPKSTIYRNLYENTGVTTAMKSAVIRQNTLYDDDVSPPKKQMH